MMVLRQHQPPRGVCYAIQGVGCAGSLARCCVSAFSLPWQLLECDSETEEC